METLQKLRSLELYLSSHPDCEVHSECADRLSDVQELLKEVSDNSHQIEKLEADKAELVKMMEKVIVIQDKYFGEQEIHNRLRALCVQIESLIQKHKQ